MPSGKKGNKKAQSLEPQCFKMAERTGFEPVEDRLDLHRFSKPAHSTTLPSLLKFEERAYRMRSDEVNPKDESFRKDPESTNAGNASNQRLTRQTKSV